MLIVFFSFLFFYLNFLAIWVLSAYKFREDLFSRVFNFASFFLFFQSREKAKLCIPIRNINNKADSCFCLSMRSTHVPREKRILTKLFQCHSKGPLLHSKRTKCVISSKTQNDYIFREQILSQFGEIGFGKINKPKNTLRGYRVYFELLNKEPGGRKLVRGTGK